MDIEACLAEILQQMSSQEADPESRMRNLGILEGSIEKLQVEDARNLRLVELLREFARLMGNLLAANANQLKVSAA